MVGIVKWFDQQRGFGFITTPNGDVFIHTKAIREKLRVQRVLFPGDDDPLSFALAVSAVVREAREIESALDRLIASRNQNFDAVTRWLTR